MRSGLEVCDLRVTFGGLVAVDDASLQAPPNRITGLIGPNGAGKTTLFNACTGHVPIAEGSVLMDGKNLSRVSTSARARLGLGRTFQRMELCEDLTVEDNVSLGREAGLAGRRVIGQLVSSRSEVAEIAEAAAAAMELCDLTHLASRPVTELSTGQRRLVEFARVLAGSYSILLLDEPSSGLDATETEHFGMLLREAIGNADLGILLVEHDMDLVLEVCDHIFVLDFGRIIFEGTPTDVRRSDAVRKAYLGEVL
jgi:ABC-type branched-subunit amino acid transport system ATPase component